jgi:MFS family permease
LGTLFGFPAMRARLHADFLHQGELSSLLIAGLWFSTVLAGPVIDRFGNRLALSASCFLAMAAFLIFSRADSFLFAATGAVVLGFGGGGLNTSGNAVVSELYPENRGAMLNLLAITLGLGAVAVPVLAARISLPAAIYSAAGLATASGISCLLLKFPPATEAEAFSLREAARVVAYPGVLLFSFLLFFESANEQVMNTFASTWAEAAGATARGATFVLAGFELCMALGRVLAARLLARVSKERLVLVSATGAVAGAALLFWRQELISITVGVLFIGTSLSAIFPTVLAMAGDRYRRFAGTIFGTLFAISLVGAAAAPAAVGALAKNHGVHFGTIVPLAGAIMVLVFMTAVIRDSYRKVE